MYFYCEKCKKKYPINSHSYQCECGGMFKLHRDPGEEYVDEISLGEVVTPLVEFKSGKLDFLLKLEGTQPTGSFKDRGARRLINEIKHVGIEKIALRLGDKVDGRPGERDHDMYLYFVGQENVAYYHSAAFGRILQYLQRNPARCKIRERNGKRSFLIGGVPTVSQALDILRAIAALGTA